MVNPGGKIILAAAQFPLCPALKEDPCNNQQDINNLKDYSAKPTFLCILNPNFQFKEQGKRQDDHSSSSQLIYMRSLFHNRVLNWFSEMHNTSISLANYELLFGMSSGMDNN